MTDFAIGQRWLSENETELGLGVIENVDYRLVTVFFPASEDHRTYAKNNAPLSRMNFQPGEQIETLHGELLTVDRVEQLNRDRIEASAIATRQAAQLATTRERGGTTCAEPSSPACPCGADTARAASASACHS